MNIRLIGLLVLGATASTVHAQPQLDISIKSGLDNAYTTGATTSKAHIYGFSGGLASYLRWSLSRRVSLGVQVDLLYTPRGIHFVESGERVALRRQHYIDVGAMVRPEVDIGPFDVYALLGASWNILLHAKLENFSPPREDDVTSFVSRHDLALAVGAGIAVRLPRHQLGPFRFDAVFLEARHDRGLIDIATSSDVRNRATSLLLGVSFAFGSRSTAPKAPVAAVGHTK